MKSRNIPAGLILILAMIFSGCSGGGMNPAMPDESIEPVNSAALDGGVPQLWGMWEVSVNEDHTSVEITPVRAADAHYNVIGLMEFSPCSTCLSIVQVQPSGQGYLNVTVELRHPYPGSDTYTGFDVRGIVMFDGSGYFPTTDFTYSKASEGDGELLNADGFTNLYNITTEGHGMRGYIPGKMASDPGGNSLLNGYKKFYTSENRMYFAAGDTLQVVYHIKPPAGAFRFGYAVDANWAVPLNHPNPSVPDDFPPSANCPGAYQVSATVADLPADMNGISTLTVDVWDHQGQGTIEEVFIEAPDIFAGVIAISFVEAIDDYFRFEGDVVNTAGVEMGDYRALIGVKDIMAYLAPPWMDINSYQLISVHVGPPLVPDGIFVDGDYPGNDGGLPEFGTPDEPFDTIVEGVVAALAGDDVYVDPLQNDQVYQEEIQLKNGLQIHGLNWRDDGDSGKPIVQGPSNAEQTFYGNDVGDVLIEGFEIRIPDNINDEFLYCIFLDTDWGEHPSGCVIRDNYFTGYIDNIGGSYGDEWELIKAYASDDILIEYNLFADCHVQSFEGGFLAAMWLSSCENPIIRYNRIINNESRNSFVGIIADYADYITIHNNEIGGWHRLGESWVNINWAINVVSNCVEANIYQNEIHDLDPLPGYATGAGIFVRVIGSNYGTWNVHNNLIYNMHSSLGYENPVHYNRGIFFRLDSSSIHLAKLEIANNTIYNQTSGFYNSGVHLEKYSSAGVDDLNIFNNIVVKQLGPDVMDPDEPTAAFRLDYGTAEDDIHFCLSDQLDHLTFFGFVEGVGYLEDVDPLFGDPGTGNFWLDAGSPAQQGSPYIVDWDDTGFPSDNPSDTNTDTRSRMGAFGGSGGNWIPPSQE